jgi:hypothetical protein
LKEGGELCAFPGVKRRTDLAFMLAGGADDLLEQLLAPGGEAQGVGTTIAGARLAFDEPALFKFVDEHHDTTAREPEVVGEHLLREPIGGGNVAQRAGVLRLQTEGDEAVFIEPAALGAKLGQQESWAAG